MHRLYFTVLTALGALVATAPEAQAQFGFHRGCRYGGGYGYYRPGPAVYGYGPFGYPAYGFSGISFGGFTAGVVTVGPGAYPAYPGYPMGYTYIPAAPMPIQAHPVIVGQNPFDNPVLNEWQPQPEQPFVGQNQPLVGQAPQPQFVQPGEARRIPEVRMPIRPSNAEGRRKAIRALAQGDEAFRMQRWAQAFVKYKEAATFAGDQADPHFRMGVTLTAMNQYGPAADAFKRGLRIDPNWPASAATLDDLYGDANILAKQTMLQRGIAWARDDIRDSERSFVLGVLLFLDRDPERAAQFLQASVQLGGSRADAQAFLNPQPVAGRDNVQPVVPADRNQVAPLQIPAPPREKVVPAAPQPQLPQPELPIAPANPGSPAQESEAGPRLPAAPPPSAAPLKKPAPARGPARDSSDGFGPAVPVLPAAPENPELRARIEGPQLVLPNESLPEESAAQAPKVNAPREVTFVRPPTRNSATIYRGRQRFEFFPKGKPVIDKPTIIEDTGSR